MKLIYIDEAGNTGAKADPDQPIHMIGALIVDQNQIRKIEIKLRILAEICADLINASGHFVLVDQIEFHGSELYGGKKYFPT